jgi:hypothetical protein
VGTAREERNNHRLVNSSGFSRTPARFGDCFCGSEWIGNMEVIQFDGLSPSRTSVSQGPKKSLESATDKAG